MTYTQINATIASAVSGENVHFAGGTVEAPAVYQLPFAAGANNYSVTSGAHLVADGVAILRGPDPTSGVVVRLNSTNSRISGFIIENAAKGITCNANFDPSNPIIISGNTIQNVDTGISWDNVDVVGDNSLPSVIVDGNYFFNMVKAQKFDSASGGSSNIQTAWLKASNNTHENVNVIIQEPVFYLSGGQNGVASGALVTLGVNDFDGNIFINSSGVTFPPDAYTAIGGPIPGNQGNVASGDIPDANGEMHIAQNPTDYPYTNSMQNVWGGYNVASEDINDAVVSWSRRPIYRRAGQGPSSPFVGDGKCKKVDGSERHYCGAFAPMGDTNGDGVLNDFDQSALLSVMTDDGVPATTANRQIFDFDGDGDIDSHDLGEFTKGYVGSNPVIPTLGEYGAGALALLLLGAGARIAARRPPVARAPGSDGNAPISEPRAPVSGR